MTCSYVVFYSLLPSFLLEMLIGAQRLIQPNPDSELLIGGERKDAKEHGFGFRSSCVLPGTWWSWVAGSGLLFG